MPQLNPNPWFFFLLTSWLNFSLIIQPNLLSFTTPNPSSNKTPTAIKITPWTWLWT